jgi:hypothetical protein
LESIELITNDPQRAIYETILLEEMVLTFEITIWNSIIYEYNEHTQTHSYKPRADICTEHCNMYAALTYRYI